MSPSRLLIATTLALLAFAGNSVLCRIALADPNGIDAASFTSIRLAAGAAALALLVRWSARAVTDTRAPGDWWSALALFVYAACFSFAYRGLHAGAGALLLFGAVQISMIGWGLFRGERLTAVQWLGLTLAAAGLGGMLLPGLSAPPWTSAALILGAGVAWGVYSIRGRGAGDPLQVTAGNFMRACLFAAVLSLAAVSQVRLDAAGIGYAVLSGALTSGVGYAVWYTALRGLTATVAATVQLSVPPIAAVGGIIWLGEPLTVRLAVASAVILGGIALVIRSSAADR